MFAWHCALEQEKRDRMLVIAGVGYQTLFRLAYEAQFFGLWEHTQKIRTRQRGNPHREGDGSVPLASAALEDVTIRYVRGAHGALPNMEPVYADVVRWFQGDELRLPATVDQALSAHLASEDGSTIPHLDGSAVPRDEALAPLADDDLGRWDLEQLDSARCQELEARLDAGTMPEFTRVRLL